MNVVKKEIEVHAPPQTVWRHLEDPDLLAGWLMRNDFRAEKGREFRFFATPRGEWDGVVHCRLVELDPPRRMAFTWNANDIGADTLVSIDLVPVGESTLVRLHHSRFDDAPGDVEPIVERHDAGWTDHLGVLALQAAEESRGGQEASRPIDWTEFSLHVAIGAAPEEIFERWSTAQGLESFFVEMMRITGPDGVERGHDEPAEPGDRFIWRWQNGRRVRGEFLAPVEEDEVRFTFVDSTVSVRAVPYGEGSLVQLRQFGIPDTDEARMHIHANCRGGWVYFLTVLKTLLEHGVDGRDPSRETGASFSTYFDPATVGIEL